MQELSVVFALLIFTGVGDGRVEVPNDLRFHDLNDCLYFAERISHRYTSYRYLDLDPRDRVVTYCKPITVNINKVKVY